MRAVAVVLIAAISVLLAGCNADAVSFQANHVVQATGGPQGVNLNDEIAVQFSQEIDPGSASAEAIRVTHAGRRLAIRVRSVNDVLLIAPADPEGWPQESRLSVEVPYPWLGRPIRSAAGAPNGAPFYAEVMTGRGYGSRGGALKLLYHSLPFSGGTDVTPDAEFLFEFDGLLDPDSIETGVAIEDVTQGERVAGFAAAVTSPRRLSVAPFAGHGFRPGTHYRLTLGTALRGQDARRLAAPLAFVFATTRSRSGEFTTDFRPDRLEDPALKPQKGPLVPRPILLTLPLGEAVTHERGEPFGREPSRVQVLIPASTLPLENALVTGMSFRVFGVDTTSLRLSARLDYAAGAHADQLGRSFEENWNLPASRPRDLIGSEGEVHILSPEDGRLNFTFQKPFFYDVSGPSRRSLVLEIVNESGVLNDSAGIVLLGEQSDRASPIVFLDARGEWLGEGERQTFVPALTLSIQRGFEPVRLKPWTTTTVESPEYFRRPDDVIATPGFVNFQIDYRALDDPADAVTDEGWSEELSALTGHRTIQARIRFLLRSAEPLPKDAGLIRLTVPFRERRE